MPIVNKTKNTAAIYNRGREVVKVYDHGTLAWQKQSSIPDYLCFTALEAGQFTLTIPAALSTNAYSHLSYIEWSKDGRNWNRTENKNSTEITISVDVVTGDKVYWRGSGTSMTSASVALTSDCRFTSTARFNASGHLLSLLKLDDYDATTGWSSATFANLFYQATTLIDASGIILPALAAGNAYTFCGTFNGCTNLVAAPDFNTSYTGNFMCFQMYRGCTSLTTMPKLPTTLSTSIFSGMFRGCTSLAITQPLNYSTLAENCFANMFNGCSSLSYVKCLATDISATGCLTNWLSGVSSTGTFIQASGVEWPRGASGIPTGWVDIEKRTMPSGYKQVEYLQGMGASRINLGIQFQKNIRILQDITYLSQNTFSWGMNAQNYEVIWGPGKGVDNFYFGLGRSNDGRKWTPNTYYEYDYDFTEGAMVAKINNEIYRQTTGSQPTQNTIYLFCYNNKETDLRNLYMRSQYFKLYMNGVLTKDLVASVRESDGMAGFYDFVNDTLLTSDTDTPFTAGEEI